MNVSLGKLKDVVHEMVKTGHYASVNEVIQEGVRLVQEREAKLSALRKTLHAAIELGGAHSAEDVSASLDAVAEELAAQGF